MFRSISIKARLICLIGFLSLQVIIGGFLYIISLGHTNASMKAMYDDCVVPMGLLDLLVRRSVRNEAEIVKATMLGQQDRAKIIGEIHERMATADKAWNEYLTTRMTPGEKMLADELAQARQRYLADGIRPALAALEAGDNRGAHAIIHGPLPPLMAQIRAAADALIKFQREKAKSRYEQSQDLYRLVRNVGIVATLFGVALAAVVGRWLVGKIIKPLDKAVRVATNMAEGNLADKIEVRSNDEAGKLMQALKNLRDSTMQKTKMARLGSWRLDPDTQAMTWSTEVTQLFGSEHLQSAPRLSDFLQRLHDEDRLCVKTGLERVITIGDEFTVECRIQRPDGAPFWVQMAARRSIHDGRVVLRGITIDITDRKQALESLERSQRVLRDLSIHQQHVKEEERRRIAREVHDELGQTLLALRIDVSSLAARTALTHPRLNQRVRDVLEQLDATVKSVRGIINNLRPPALDLGLEAAIEWQVSEFSRRSGIDCELVLDAEDCALDDQHATTLFRILQESLTNVTKHAQASHVRVELHSQGDRLTLRIDDNGIGIDSEARRKTGSFGLVGIEERVHTLNGEFQIISVPGNGTWLGISIPLADEVKEPTTSFFSAVP